MVDAFGLDGVEKVKIWAVGKEVTPGWTSGRDTDT